MEEYIVILLRTLLLYAIIVLVFRMMGKREIGELSILDLVVYIMIAEIAVAAIEDIKTELVPTILPIFILLLIQIGLAALSLKSKKIRDLIDGKPTIIINKGKIDEKAMRSQRYNMDDLLLQLREKDVRNVADVEFAILETSGKLSVFEKEPNKSGVTIPLIIDGVIQEASLKEIGKSHGWLQQELKKQGHLKIDKISFCSFQDDKFYIDYFDEK
ncbi:MULTISPECIES: DUF421 domain-containing protein [Bacillaceae]|uniref:DUF421 domain-containing protein n=1 Tax=Bacillaceae TaxID=186817 RepID=UPI001E45E059|nr:MULTISPECIES: DUF421 domain-containing protein [Bacillaceae]MCE4046910.1 DUF421 domain-containing protein [Bacillus sp. Au-Bac7]MCM3030013.1 DUF421 domain-containing protein [Niallia sp. MER 6]MDL0436307.1 DUF421 domain-containing protein [Niallia sp. SS-2023]UPO86701.1 DUF421 domain-containing protein [Niallia sp. Man26]